MGINKLSKKVTIRLAVSPKSKPLRIEFLSKIIVRVFWIMKTTVISADKKIAFSGTTYQKNSLDAKD